MTGAAMVVLAAKLWLVVGGLVAAPFVVFGIDRLDEDARGAYVFRPLLVPAILLIWPLVLWRWYVLETGKDVWENRYRPARHRHKWVAGAMPVAIVAILMTGLMVRQVWPVDIDPRRIASSMEIEP